MLATCHILYSHTTPLSHSKHLVGVELMCLKVENQHDFRLDERVEEAAEEAMGIAEPEIAPAVVLSRCYQDQELSAMVSALTRVVAGEVEPMAAYSSPSPMHVASPGRSSPSSTSSGGQKRGREEVLQYYTPRVPDQFGGCGAGEASSTVSISGDLMSCLFRSPDCFS